MSNELKQLNYKKVEKKDFDKSLFIPTSKSYANRMLILAAVKKGPVRINSLPPSTDVEKLIECFIEVGLEVERDGKKSVLIKNSFPECEANIDTPLTLNTGDGGTTNRFIIGMLSLGKREYVINPEGHMKKRPMEEMTSILKDLKVSIQSGKNKWLSLKGPVQFENSSISVDCARSTQFATAFLLAYSQLDLEIKIENLKSSKQYLELTHHLVESSKKVTEFDVPIDFSSISYPIAMGAVDGKLNVENFKGVDELQADSILISILEKMNADISFDNKSLVVKKSKLTPIEVECSQFPDLVPTLAFICAYADGMSNLKNLEVLRHKECDRVEEVINILKTFNVKYELNNNDDLKIFGDSNRDACSSVKYLPPKDHRMVMVSYLFMRKNNGGLLGNSHHVKKSFANFFELMD